MAYLKTIAWVVIASVALGAGVIAVMVAFGRGVEPADRATVLAASISEAMNCTAFLAIFVSPFAIVNTFLSRRHARRTSGAPTAR